MTADEIERAVLAFDELVAQMRSAGFAKSVGFGETPAVIAVDLIKGFTDPEYVYGLECTGVVEATRRLLDHASELGLPTILIASAYEPARRDAGVWERKLTHEGLYYGTDAVELDDRLGHREGDIVIVKKFPSCFFATNLASLLTSLRVDTVVLAGVSTSGCVRASAVDACSSGFRTIVVEDAVGDRSPLPHRANLFDIEMKYGDVISLDAALAGLSESARSSRRPG